MLFNYNLLNELNLIVGEEVDIKHKNHTVSIKSGQIATKNGNIFDDEEKHIYVQFYTESHISELEIDKIECFYRAKNSPECIKPWLYNLSEYYNLKQFETLIPEHNYTMLKTNGEQERISFLRFEIMKDKYKNNYYTISYKNANGDVKLISNFEILDIS